MKDLAGKFTIKYGIHYFLYNIIAFVLIAFLAHFSSNVYITLFNTTRFINVLTFLKIL